MVRLSRFQVDFSITKRLISDAVATYFLIDPKEMRQNRLDESYDSKDSNHRAKRKTSLIQDRILTFETLKRNTQGLTHSLQSYAKDLMRGLLTLKQEASLRKKSGLLDFLQELNDCQKNLLRFMSATNGSSSSSCFSMYAVDFLWKLMLVRVEFILDDEEQRLSKLQKYYEGELRKEVAEVK